MAIVTTNKALKIFFIICVLMFAGFLWQHLKTEQTIFYSRGTLTEERDVIREHIVRDVEIDRRNIVIAARELLQGRQAENEAERKVICPNFNGGLGNMLFQYASAYGIGQRVGLDILVKADSEMFQIFDITSKVSTEKSICAKAKIMRERKSGVFDDSLFAIRNNADYIAKGYLQSWRYFEPYKKDIRKQLRFRGDIEKKAHDLLASKLKDMYGKGNYSSRTLVGVHVRRGNLLNKQERAYGYRVADKAYMEKAQSFFRQKFKHVTFIVCSNDMKWSRANVSGNDVIFIDGNPRDVDLALLSSLNHTLITVGTFGWWAAWMANGTTVYFSDFIRKGSKFSTQFAEDRQDYLYPGWIGM